MLQEITKPILSLIEDLGIVYATETSKQKRRYGLYRCECGNEFKAQATSVKNGKTSSCGCLRRKTLIKRNTTHGLTNNKLYHIWSSMRARCNNPNNKWYINWGGRGITVCEEWQNNFKSFYDWAISNGYKDGLSIDRIDNNGNYEQNNCRFTTREIQSRNTRILSKNNTSGYRGVTLNKKTSRWSARIMTDNKSNHLGYFNTSIEAAKAYNQYVIDNNLEHTLNML